MLRSGTTTSAPAITPAQVNHIVSADAWEIRDRGYGAGTGPVLYASNTGGDNYSYAGINAGGWQVHLSADLSTFTVSVPAIQLPSNHNLYITFYRPYNGYYFNRELDFSIGQPANTSDAIEYLAAHSPQSSYSFWQPAPNFTDLNPGDTTTGYTDAWVNSASIVLNTSARVLGRYHYNTAQEMHGFDFTFTNTEGFARYTVQASLDAYTYDVFIPATVIPGVGTHRVQLNTYFTPKNYNFYEVIVEGVQADTNSAVTLSDFRLYPFFAPTAALSGATTVTPGGSASLAFVTEFVENAYIDNGVGGININISGNVSVNPSVTTTYTLTGASRHGSVSSSVTITVQEDVTPTATLTCPTPTIKLGESALLSYSTSNASEAYFTPNIAFIKPDVSGNVQIFPLQTTTYTLTAKSSRQAIASLTINVGETKITGCMDPAATNYNPLAAQDTVPTSCIYSANFPTSVGKGTVRRPVAVTVAGHIVVPSLATDFSSPPSITVSLSPAQKNALGLTSTVTNLQGLAFHAGAKLQVPTVDIALYDPAACSARVSVRLDNDGTVTFFLLPGPYSDSVTPMSEFFAAGPGQLPYLVPGTWHVWALLVLSAYRW